MVSNYFVAIPYMINSLLKFPNIVILRRTYKPYKIPLKGSPYAPNKSYTIMFFFTHTAVKIFKSQSEVNATSVKTDSVKPKKIITKLKNIFKQLIKRNLIIIALILRLRILLLLLQFRIYLIFNAFNILPILNCCTNDYSIDTTSRKYETPELFVIHLSKCSNCR